MKWILISAIIVIAIALIGLIAFNTILILNNKRSFDRIPRRGPGATALPQSEFSGNGERIFLTGTGSRGPIATTGGPIWFQSHDGGCAVCHGPDGQGGVVAMESFRAPNITYKVLTSSDHEDGDHPPYTDSLIKRAITQSIDSGGENLSASMPRWQMSDDDSTDVVDYLKTLDP